METERTNIKKNKKALLTRLFIIIGLLIGVTVIFSLSASQLFHIFLLFITGFGIIVLMIFFWRIFLWIIAAAILIVLIFCGIALFGYIGSLLS
ncbi:MAG: hypothetical protein ACQEWW_26340 [Bacillota bacterium]